jgi:hypothetical protein
MKATVQGDVPRQRARASRRGRRVAFVLCALTAGWALFARSPRAQARMPAVPREIATALQEKARFAAADLDQLAAGQVIVRTEVSRENFEAAVAAAVGVRTAKDRALAYFRQVLSFEDGEVTLRFGLFSTPPTLADVSRLTLDSAALDDLRSCRPRDCGVRVGAQGAAEFARAIDWRAPDAAERATERARQALVAYAGAYLSRGDAALITYDDRSEPVSLQGSWRSVVERSPALAAYAPALERHLIEFPGAALPGATDEVYWDQQHLTGLKTITGVTHLVTWRDPEHPNRAVVAQKQIYASHYFYGSLALTSFIEDRSDPQRPVTWMIYFNRSRGDLLKGGFGGLRQRAAESMVKESAQSLLSAMKRELER